MEKSSIKKVGIYLQNGGSEAVLVVRLPEGTSYFQFPVSDFIKGWNRPRLSKPKSTSSPICKEYGAISAIRSSNRPSPILDDAIMSYSITPSFLNRCGNTSRKKVKWATKKKGNWGGKRT